MILNDGESKILQGLVKHLNELYPGEIVLVQLFGSRARGSAALDSDYDILVVVKERTKVSRSAIYEYVLDVNLKYGIDLSLKIYGVSEFEAFKAKGVPFINEVLQEGYSLWTG